MALIFEIYNTEIDQQYIKSYPVSKQSFQFNDRDIIASTLKIVLDNTDPDVFSDLYTTGLFFGTDWFNQPVTVYDDELEIYTWQGRLKNIVENWQNKTVTCESTNYVRDMADTTCNYTETTNTTPAEHIYEILTDADMIGLDDDSINFDGFQNAINIQDSNSAYVDMRFTKEKNKKCLAVIKELCRISQCHLFTDKNNKISLYQFEEWNGVLGYVVKDRDVISKTYKHDYNIKSFFNDAIVYYDNGGTATQTTDSDTSSITSYGKRQFLAPDKDVNTTSSSNNILFRNVTGSTWAVDLVLARYSTMKKRFSLTLTDKFKFLELGDQIDLDFDPLVREPAQVIELNYDRNKKVVKIKGEYLNTPKQYSVRDNEPPSSVQVVDLTAGTSSMAIRWSVSTETDHVGYYLYFTATKGEWEQEICNEGRSPVQVVNPTVDGDGYNTLTIYELNSGTTYFFKVTSYDTSFNESADSNVESQVVT